MGYSEFVDGVFSIGAMHQHFVNKGEMLLRMSCHEHAVDMAVYDRLGIVNMSSEVACQLSVLYYGLVATKKNGVDRPKKHFCAKKNVLSVSNVINFISYKIFSVITFVFHYIEYRIDSHIYREY